MPLGIVRIRPFSHFLYLYKLSIILLSTLCTKKDSSIDMCMTIELLYFFQGRRAFGGFALCTHSKFGPALHKLIVLLSPLWDGPA